MWILFLKWLPIFGWILVATFLLASLIAGLRHPLKQIFGFSNTYLFGNDSRIGTLAEAFFSGGIFSVSTGLFWLVHVHHGYVHEATLINALAIGGGIGFVYTGVGIKRLISLPFKFVVKEWTHVEIMKGLITGGIFALWGALGAGMMLSNIFVRGGVLTRACIILLSGFFNGLFYGFIAAFSIGAAVGCALILGFGQIVALAVVGGMQSFMNNTGDIGWGVVGVFIVIFEFLLQFLGRYPIMMVGHICSLMTTPLLIVMGKKVLICGRCLRYSFPLKAAYKDGVRYCEHCQNIIEHTKETGKVVLTFGIVLDKPTGKRVFLISNPDLERKETPFDVTHVYIDTKTCNPLLLERFLTYILNYPPVKGLQSVQVLYQGTLDDLGDHLKNALQNTFTHIQMSQTIVATKQALKIQ